MFILQLDKDIDLRMLAARDAKALYELINQSRKQLETWLTWPSQIASAEDSLDFIKSSFEIYNNRAGITAGIFYNEKLVGIVGFNTFDWQAKIGSIGYWLATEYTGKGLMTKSVSALVNYGFVELKLNRIEIKAAEHNYSSRAIPEKLGFIQEGKIREAELLTSGYVDHIVYGLLKSEWGNSKR